MLTANFGVFRIEHGDGWNNIVDALEHISLKIAFPETEAEKYHNRTV